MKVEKTYQRTYLQIVKFHEIAKQVELQRKPDPNTVFRVQSVV